MEKYQAFLKGRNKTPPKSCKSVDVWGWGEENRALAAYGAAVATSDAMKKHGSNSHFKQVIWGGLNWLWISTALFHFSFTMPDKTGTVNRQNGGTQ